jgi:hypothetical protein
MNFRVGMRVICIFDEWKVLCGVSCGAPAKGKVYTVTSIEPWNNFMGLRLEELPEVGLYDVNGFRPAVEPSIEIFTAMLKKTRKENVRLARRPVRENA